MLQHFVGATFVVDYQGLAEVLRVEQLKIVYLVSTTYVRVGVTFRVRCAMVQNMVLSMLLIVMRILHFIHLR